MANGRGSILDHLRKSREEKKNNKLQNVIEFCDFCSENSSVQQSSIHAWWFVYQLHNAKFSTTKKTKWIANSTDICSLNRYVCARYIHWHSFNWTANSSNTHLNNTKECVHTGTTIIRMHCIHMHAQARHTTAEDKLVIWWSITSINWIYQRLCARKQRMIICISTWLQNTFVWLFRFCCCRSVLSSSLSLLLLLLLSHLLCVPNQYNTNNKLFTALIRVLAYTRTVTYTTKRLHHRTTL